MAKYVIEIPGEVKWIQYIQQTHHGTQNLKVESVYDLTPYTEQDEQFIKNNNIHLCWSCQNSYPECHAKVKDVLFGDGVGNDNICCCNAYRPTKPNAQDEDEIRQKAHGEAWELFGVIANMDYDDYEHCFGEGCEDWKIYKLSYQGAKAKYDAWRKQKDEIRVGDEVQYSLAGYEYTFIVFGKENDVLYGMRTDEVDMDDICEAWDYCNKSDSTLEKTGRHFPEVVELLKKMKGK